MDGNHDSTLIPPHGGYAKLLSFQAAQRVYDATVIFCGRFIPKQSRTHDQMVQAARSCVQNIAEGSAASATSRKIELKLTGVAKASVEELLNDYQDFLRQRELRAWGKDSPEAVRVRGRYRELSSPRAARTDPYGISEASAEDAANTLICMIHQVSFLLFRQLKALEAKFLEEGSFTEKLYRERTKRREGQQGNGREQ